MTPLKVPTPNSSSDPSLLWRRIELENINHSDKHWCICLSRRFTNKCIQVIIRRSYDKLYSHNILVLHTLLLVNLRERQMTNVYLNDLYFLALCAATVKMDRWKNSVWERSVGSLILMCIVRNYRKMIST